MKKIEKLFKYLTGSFLAVSSGMLNSDSIQYLYGVETVPAMTTSQKIVSIIFSPLILIVIIILALIIGLVVFFKRKGQNVKKDS